MHNKLKKKKKKTFRTIIIFKCNKYKHPMYNKTLNNRLIIKNKVNN